MNLDRIQLGIAMKLSMNILDECVGLCVGIGEEVKKKVIFQKRQGSL